MSKKAKPTKPIFQAVRLTQETRHIVERIGPISEVPVKESWYGVISTETDGSWYINALLGESLFKHFFAWVDKENPGDLAEVYERKFS